MAARRALISSSGLTFVAGTSRLAAIPTMAAGLPKPRSSSELAAMICAENGAFALSMMSLSFFIASGPCSRASLRTSAS